MKTYALLLSTFFAIFFLSGCQLMEEPGDPASLSLDFSPSEIVLEEANEYKQEVNFEWSITNLSKDVISNEDYVLDIASAVPGSYESTLITELDFEVLPGESLSGEHTYLISGISVEGDFEFQLNLYEKSGQYMTELMGVSKPYSLYWGQ